MSLDTIIKDANRIFVLTGAGMSTDSGIPDFRSSTGLYKSWWKRIVFCSWVFKLFPRLFWWTMGKTFKDFRNALPNAGHTALAALEYLGKKVTVATQNIDGLHQTAGSTNVIELHGSLQTCVCPKCGRCFDAASLSDIIDLGKAPHCVCGAVLKPDFVFFGDTLDVYSLVNAQQAVMEADLVLVVGTSLSVHPVDYLPLFRKKEAKLVIINDQPTCLDAKADLVLHENISETLSAVVKSLNTVHKL